MNWNHIVYFYFYIIIVNAKKQHPLNKSSLRFFSMYLEHSINFVYTTIVWVWIQITFKHA